MINMRRFYKKKPLVVEAIQWTGKNFDEVARFVGDDFGYKKAYEDEQERAQKYGEYTVREFDGNELIYSEQAIVGDWIIKDVKGEFYTCKPDIFEATYDLLAIEIDSEYMGTGSETYMGSRDF